MVFLVFAVLIERHHVGAHFFALLFVSCYRKMHEIGQSRFSIRSDARSV